MRYSARSLVILCLVLVGCGDGSDVTTEVTEADRGVATMGEALFAERVVGANPGCVTCHSHDEGVTLVGPSMWGLAARAGQQVPGLSAEQYVRQSVVDPDAFIVPGFVAGQMPGGWQELLSAEQIDSLVDALLEE